MSNFPLLWYFLDIISSEYNNALKKKWTNKDKTNWENKIDFLYNVKDGDNIENSFTNRFKIRYITTDYYFDWTPSPSLSKIELKYSPYQISCEIWDGDEIDNLIIVARVNDNRDYCFEIKQNNCRLTEMSEEDCNILTKKVDK